MPTALIRRAIAIHVIGVALLLRERPRRRPKATAVHPAHPPIRKEERPLGSVIRRIRALGPALPALPRIPPPRDRPAIRALRRVNRVDLHRDLAIEAIELKRRGLAARVLLVHEPPIGTPRSDIAVLVIAQKRVLAPANLLENLKRRLIHTNLTLREVIAIISRAPQPAIAHLGQRPVRAVLIAVAIDLRTGLAPGALPELAARPIIPRHPPPRVGLSDLRRGPQLLVTAFGVVIGDALVPVGGRLDPPRREVLVVDLHLPELRDHSAHFFKP